MIRRYKLILILLVLSLNAHGQQKDFRSWFTIGVGGELFNLLDVSVTPEVRLWDNSSRLEGFLTEVDASVPVFKFLRFGFNYRYQADFENPEQVSHTNRYGIYGQASKNFGDFKVSYRAFYHQEYTDMNTSELGKVPFVQHRHKISLKYGKKDWKLSPAVSAEMFYTISPAWDAFQERLRLSAGIDYEISEILEAGIGYKFQQEFYERNPLSSHILSLGLKVNL
jgi:hypothetical protein